MYAKLMTLTVMLVVIAGLLLVLRQERLEIAYDCAALHRQIDPTRAALWRQQVDAGQTADPVVLYQHLAAAEVSLEAVGGAGGAAGVLLATEPTHPGDDSSAVIQPALHEHEEAQ